MDVQLKKVSDGNTKPKNQRDEDRVMHLFYCSLVQSMWWCVVCEINLYDWLWHSFRSFINWYGNQIILTWQYSSLLPFLCVLFYSAVRIKSTIMFNLTRYLLQYLFFQHKFDYISFEIFIHCFFSIFKHFLESFQWLFYASLGTFFWMQINHLELC